MDQFKIPFLLQSKEQTWSTRDPNLQEYKKNLLIKGEELGRGSFGVVYKATYAGSQVVIKELHKDDFAECSRKRLIKEAKLMKELQCDNVIKFLYIGYMPPSLIMEYACFDFKPFGGSTTECHSLSTFLSFVNVFKMRTIEHFHDAIAQGLLNGLNFLHQHGIAHRDLKPSNVLVCNQHYANLEDGEIKSNLLKECPIKCKLTDFGEARSQLLQTRSLLETRTVRLQRGTLAFMAPEQFEGPMQLKSAAQNDLMMIDIWQLGMTLFCILNPDLSSPYLIELDQVENAGIDARMLIKNILLAGGTPLMSSKYELQRSIYWSTLEKIYFLCITSVPSLRPSSEQLLIMLSENEAEPIVVPMSLSQATAIEEYDSKFATNRTCTLPENDGSGCCTFLCLKIAFEVMLLQKEDVVPIQYILDISESVISSYPYQINKFRDTDKLYDPLEAYELMKSCDPSTIELELTYDLSPEHNVLSSNGIKDLEQQIAVGVEKKCFFSIYVCEPYTFLIGALEGRPFLVDTHPVCSTESGRKTGMIMMSNGSSPSDISRFVKALIKRLFESGIPENAKHTLSTICPVTSTSLKQATQISDSLESPGDHSNDSVLLSRQRTSLKQATQISDSLESSGDHSNVFVMLSRQRTSLKQATQISDSLESPGDHSNDSVLLSRQRTSLKQATQISDSLESPGNSYDSVLLSRQRTSLKQATQISDSLESPGDHSNDSVLLSRQRTSLKQATQISDSLESPGNSYDSVLLSRQRTSLKQATQISDNLESSGDHSNDSVLLSRLRCVPVEDGTVGENWSPPLTNNTGKDKTFPRLPSQSISLKRKLEICICEAIDPGLVCKSVPMASVTNSIYVIDLKAVDKKDLTTDSLVYDKHSCPKDTIIVALEGTKVKHCARSNPGNEQGLGTGEFLVSHRRQYSYLRNAFCTLTRCITRFECATSLQARYALISYRICTFGELGFVKSSNPLRRPHRNSKVSKEKYFRTKPSVLAKIKSLGAFLRPKQIVTAIEKDAGGLISIASPRDTPRNRRQVHNVVRHISNRPRARNTGKNKEADFTKLLALAQSGDFVRDFSFSKNSKKNCIVPRVFAATDLSLRWIKQYCSPSSKFTTPVGIDMTYKCGPFYLTTVTMKHPLFVYRERQQQHPTVLLAIMTSPTKERSDYEYLATQLQAQGINHLVYGTDGELAMEQALEKFYPIDTHNIHLRCFAHFAEDLRRFLSNLGQGKLSIDEVIKTILGRERGEVREEGLVDSDDEETFEKMWLSVEKQWPAEFVSWTKQTKGRLRNIPDTIKKCMLKPVRVAANLGNPPSKYTNNATESLNLVIKEEQHHQSLDLCSFLENIKEKVFEQQTGELIKGIYRMGELRLISELIHLSVDPSEWAMMNIDQRNAIISKVLHTYSRCNESNFLGHCAPLSVSFTDPAFKLPLPTSVLVRLWKTAEFILSNCLITTLMSGNYSVTEYNGCETVSVNKNKALVCRCSDFSQTAGLCQHVIAVAEGNGTLKSFLMTYANRKNTTAKMITANQPNRPGVKVHQKKKRRGRNNVVQQPITSRVQLTGHGNSNSQIDAINDPLIDTEKPCDFTEYWHNDELFNIVHVKNKEECKNAKVCASCGKTFAKRNPVKVRGEILIFHKERYQRPVRDDQGKFLRYTLTSPKQLGRKFYCPVKECLLKRHPYFWKGLLRLVEDDNTFDDDHLKYLYSEFHFQR